MRFDVYPAIPLREGMRRNLPGAALGERISFVVFGGNTWIRED